MRAVLDTNILIAALLSRSGAPAQLLARWIAGDFELVVSDMLLDELERALAYPRLRKHITDEEARAFVSMLAQSADTAPDPGTSTHHSADPNDDYLLALAESTRSVLVSGDHHLLDLSGGLPIQTARAFLEGLRD